MAPDEGATPEVDLPGQPPPPPPHGGGVDLGRLRILTVVTVVALVAFEVVGNFVDDVALGNRYTPDLGTLVPLLLAIIAGEFSAEAIAAARGKRD